MSKFCSDEGEVLETIKKPQSSPAPALCADQNNQKNITAVVLSAERLE
jgi:hypothetical protein